MIQAEPRGHQVEHKVHGLLGLLHGQAEVLSAEVAHRFESGLASCHHVHAPQEPVDGEVEACLAPPVDRGSQLIAGGRTKCTETG